MLWNSFDVFVFDTAAHNAQTRFCAFCGAPCWPPAARARVLAATGAGGREGQQATHRGGHRTQPWLGAREAKTQTEPKLRKHVSDLTMELILPVTPERL